MTGKVTKLLDDFHTITPHLTVRGVADAIEFYCRAFGAAELYRNLAPDGKSIMHAELMLGDSRFFLHDEFPEHGEVSPLGGQPTGVKLHLYVDDVDDMFQAAVEAGANRDDARAGLFLGRSVRHPGRPVRPSLVDRDPDRRPFAPSASKEGQRVQCPPTRPARRFRTLSEYRDRSQPFTGDQNHGRSGQAHSRRTSHDQGERGSSMRSLVWVFALIASGLAAAPAVGLSQEGRDQAQAMKRDVPGPIHQRLNELAGSWDVAVRYTIANKQHEGKATCEAKWILDGRFLQQEYHSRFQGKPYQVVQLLGFDNLRKKTFEIMMDNLGTGVLHNEGSISEDGKVITNVGQSLDPVTGKPYKLRTVTTIVDRDHFTLEWFHADDGGKEDRVVSMSHTRKKS